MHHIHQAKNNPDDHDEAQTDVFRKVREVDTLKYEESAAAQALDLNGRVAEYENSMKVLCLATTAMTLVPGVGLASLVVVAMISLLLFSLGILQIFRRFGSEGELTLIAALVTPLMSVIVLWIKTLVVAV